MADTKIEWTDKVISLWNSKPILFKKLDYEDFEWMLKQRGLIQGDQYHLDL
jgi:hypothetical protein